MMNKQMEMTKVKKFQLCLSWTALRHRLGVVPPPNHRPSWIWLGDSSCLHTDSQETSTSFYCLRNVAPDAAMASYSKWILKTWGINCAIQTSASACWLNAEADVSTKSFELQRFDKTLINNNVRPDCRSSGCVSSASTCSITSVSLFMKVFIFDVARHCCLKRSPLLFLTPLL